MEKMSQSRPFMIVRDYCRQDNCHVPVKKKKTHRRQPSTSQGKMEATLQPAEPAEVRSLLTEDIHMSLIQPKLRVYHPAFDTDDNQLEPIETKPDLMPNLIIGCSKRRQPSLAKSVDITRALVAAGEFSRVSAGRLRTLIRHWSDQLTSGLTDLDTEDNSYSSDDSSEVELASTPVKIGEQPTLANTYSGLSLSASVTSVQNSSSVPETVSRSNSKHEPVVDSRGAPRQLISDEDRKGMVVRALSTLVGDAGFTHVKIHAFDVIYGVTDNFMEDLTQRLKKVAEREVSGIDHGFPDPVERVLTDIGMGGTRGLQTFINTRSRKAPNCAASS